MQSLQPAHYLNAIVSDDGKSWGKTTQITQGGFGYDLALVKFRGQLYGVTVADEHRMFITKYQTDGTWMKPWIPVPDIFRARRRVSAAVNDDRLHITYRGVNDDGLYLIYTNDLLNWSDLTHVGGKEDISTCDPVMEAYGGILWVFGRGTENAIYYSIYHREGERVTTWMKIPGTNTDHRPAISVFGGKLFLFEVPHGRAEFTWRYWYNGGYYAYITWTDPVTVAAPTITSELSVASFSANQQVITYRGEDNAVEVRFFDFFGGEKWERGATIPGGAMVRSPPSVECWAARTFVVFGESESKDSASYRAPVGMNEKGFVIDEEDDEWECKWKQQQQQEDTSLAGSVKKLFCL